MTKLWKIFSLFIFCSVFLVACNKEEIDLTTDDTNTEEPADTGNSIDDDDTASTDNDTNNYVNALTTTDSVDCFELQFPISFELEDGAIVTAETEEELEQIFEDEPEIVDFVYPLTLLTADGELVINNEEELVLALEDCFGDDWDDDDDDDDDDPWDDDDDYDDEWGSDCWEFVFPISFELEDGSTVTAEDEEALGDLFYSNDSLEIVGFVFPIQVTVFDVDEVFTVNSEDELEELLEEHCEEDCDDYDWDEDDWDMDIEECFEFSFPISFNVNGELQTAENEEEFIAILASIDVSGDIDVELVFPINVTFEGIDEVLTAQDEEELEELIEEYCED